MITLTAKPQFAGVTGGQAAQNAGKGRFTRAIAPNEGMDFA
jgi:hypothetical protein